jgi:imidazolonepropionase-like amidohydrolase
MRKSLPTLAGVIVSACLGTAAASQLRDTAGQLALVGGTIYASPTEEPIRNGVILISAGKIVTVGSRTSVRVPRGIQIIDCSGSTITAGFWNSHVHFGERKWENVASIPGPELDRQLQDMLTRHGFTSVFDLGSPRENTWRLRDRIESGEVSGPRIYLIGQSLEPTNSVLPPDFVFTFLGVMKPQKPLEIADASEAAAASRKLLDEGVDGIKMYASSPKASLPEGSIQAAVNEARRAGKPVFVHCNSAADVLAAIQDGADVVVHTTPRSPWDDTILAAMKEKRVALNPTLHIWEYQARHDRRSAQEKITKTTVGQLRAWFSSGGAVVFGTDIGAVDSDPGGEYALMAEAGMNFRQILASLTTAPAERFGDSKQSARVAPGLQADLVVLKDDPSKNVRALAAVQYTLRAGKIIYRDSSVENR